MASSEEIKKLLLALQESRGDLGRELTYLHRNLDLGDKFKQSVRRNVSPWILGAGGSGLLLALLPRGKKKIYINEGKDKKVVKEGLLIGLVGALFSIFRPLLTSMVTRLVADYFKSPEKYKDFARRLKPTSKIPRRI